MRPPPLSVVGSQAPGAQPSELDTIKAKTVPGFFKLKLLLKQPDQFHLLGKKRIVAMCARHLPIIRIHPCRADHVCELPNRLRRKQPVRTDPHKAQPCTNSAKHLLRRCVSIQRVPGVHGAQDGQVSVGVKTVDESPPLVVQVARNIKSTANQAAAVLVQRPRVFPIPVGIAAEAFLKKRCGLVTEHPNLARQRQPLLGRFLRQIIPPAQSGSF